jgi:hypothetical protein
MFLSLKKKMEFLQENEIKNYLVFYIFKVLL